MRATLPARTVDESVGGIGVFGLVRLGIIIAAISREARREAVPDGGVRRSPVAENTAAAGAVNVLHVHPAAENQVGRVV